MSKSWLSRAYVWKKAAGVERDEARVSGKKATVVVCVSEKFDACMRDGSCLCVACVARRECLYATCVSHNRCVYVSEKKDVKKKRDHDSLEFVVRVCTQRMLDLRSRCVVRKMDVKKKRDHDSRHVVSSLDLYVALKSRGKNEKQCACSESLFSTCVRTTGVYDWKNV